MSIDELARALARRANPPRRSRQYVDRAAGLERGMQAARALGLDADDLDAACQPRRDAGDQPAAADRHQHGVERSRRAGPLPTRAPTVPCPAMRLGGVEGMHRAARRSRRRRRRRPPARRHSARRRPRPRRRALGCARSSRARKSPARRCAPCGRAAAPHRRPPRRDCRPRPPRRPPPAPSRDSRLLKAPRVLNEPACCRNSSLKSPARPGRRARRLPARRAADMGADALMRGGDLGAGHGQAEAWWTSGGSFHRSGPIFRLDRMSCRTRHERAPRPFRHESPSAGRAHRARASRERLRASPRAIRRATTTQAQASSRSSAAAPARRGLRRIRAGSPRLHEQVAALGHASRPWRATSPSWAARAAGRRSSP